MMKGWGKWWSSSCHHHHWRKGTRYKVQGTQGSKLARNDGQESQHITADIAYTSGHSRTLYVTAGHFIVRHCRTQEDTVCHLMCQHVNADTVGQDVTTEHCQALNARCTNLWLCITVHGTAMYNGKIGGPYSLNAPNRKYICQGYFCTSQYTNGSCSFFCTEHRWMSV